MSNLTDIRRTSLISLILQTVSRPIIIDIIITIWCNRLILAAHLQNSQENYVRSYFVKMVKTLNIGKQFEDFPSLEIAIQQYQKEENVQFLR